MAAEGHAEGIWYLDNSEPSVQAFLRYADRISIAAPHVYVVGEGGVLRGNVDPRVRQKARGLGVPVMPLVRQNLYDQALLSRLLSDAGARRRIARELARECSEQGYWGFQFDFENISLSDRDRFTHFFGEVAEALREASCGISIAVVPRTSDGAGPTPYHTWMLENWRGAYDYKALAEIGDFLSVMAYDQHTRHTPPGPVAGLPWVERVVEFVLSSGVPPEKLSLGIPAYSRVWYPHHDEEQGARTTARGLSYDDARYLANANKIGLRWDKKQAVHYGAWEMDLINGYVFVESVKSFKVKRRLVGKYGLRGYSVWKLGQEDRRVWE
jgi:spore germination protein YaaH